MAEAQDSSNIPRLLLVDSSGRLVLGPSTQVIGSVNEARGKTILYDYKSVTDTDGEIREVTAGTTYYLAACGLMIHATATGALGVMYIDALGTYLLQMYSATTATYHTDFAAVDSISFPHPLPIAAGASIKVYSNNANLTARGWIIGWEE